jgi:hypothetical protein
MTVVELTALELVRDRVWVLPLTGHRSRHHRGSIHAAWPAAHRCRGKRRAQRGKARVAPGGGGCRRTGGGGRACARVGVMRMRAAAAMHDRRERCIGGHC